MEITLERKQTLKGPDGIKIELDADEIYSNDPGMGTPILVSVADDGERFIASYNCAVGENEVDGVKLTDEQIEWLNDLDYALDTWLTAFTRKG